MGSWWRWRSGAASTAPTREFRVCYRAAADAARVEQVAPSVPLRIVRGILKLDTVAVGRAVDLACFDCGNTTDELVFGSSATVPLLYFEVGWLSCGQLSAAGSGVVVHPEGIANGSKESVASCGPPPEARNPQWLQWTRCCAELRVCSYLIFMVSCLRMEVFTPGIACGEPRLCVLSWH